MYNRYIPQSDGTYQRNSISESRYHAEREDMPQSASSTEKQCKPSPDKQQQSPKQSRVKEEEHIGQFFKSLLPRDFDTHDLLVVILLLLMASDCTDEQNTALLTLVLYLFL